LDGNEGRKARSKLLQLLRAVYLLFAVATATVGRPKGTGLIKTDRPYCWNARVTESWVKVKLTLKQATKTQRGSRGIALLFL